ncbi:MAG TPA: histidinol dehydrogenase [Candidatus Coprocola pullicola]|nr:histidinol dehydrogenase [Candidatus Coprocola pullicola]
MITVLKSSDNTQQKLQEILQRNQTEKNDIQQIVNDIVYDVKKNGDEALFRYTKEFDKIELTHQTVQVTEEEIKYAYTQVEQNLIKVIQKAAKRIKQFHEKQKLNSWLEPSENGEMMGQLIRPLEKVGIYVPGGKASYPSSVLMNAIPASVAGVSEIIMVTPAKKDGRVTPTTLVAAKEAGVTKIYKVGGAQAIAALAYGSTCIPKVDKICGPGNIYVALAKKSVYGQVNIDSVAGPSEILVIADDTANPVYVAADMLSQAEHDEMASAMLVTDSQILAEAVQKELQRQTALLPRKEIIEKSLKNYGLIVIAKDMQQACALGNIIAPEHMEICTKEPFSLLPKIKNAGAIFLGEYTPEPLGDYMAGPNHVLPTGGTARFFSPLSIDDFIKKSSILSFSKEALLELAEDIVTFAQAEGLTAHANAVKVRKP